MAFVRLKSRGKPEIRTSARVVGMTDVVNTPLTERELKAVKRNELTKQADEIVKNEEKWMIELNRLNDDKINHNWLTSVLKNILYRCMGIQPIAVTNVFGNVYPMYVFKDLTALKAVGMLAKLHGVDLQRELKLTFQQNNNIQNNNFYNTEIPVDTDRTQQVLEILLQAGGLKQPQIETEQEIEIKAS